MKFYELNNGVLIPIFGQGTYCFTPKEAYKSTLLSFKYGNRLVDTAQYYENERAVGSAILDSKIDRKEIFVSTKIWPSYYLDDEAVDKTLKRMQLDYIDLMFLHQPCGDYIHAYKNLEKAYLDKKIRAIGLSNFSIAQIKEVLNIAHIKPQVVQIELHPYYQEKELREFLVKENIAVMSWYPLGHGDKELLNEPCLTNMGNTYYRTNAQLLLRWQIEHNFICIPGSKSEDHISANLGVINFHLKDEDIKIIDSLNRNKPYYQKSYEKYKKYLTMELNLDDQEDGRE